ncbi:Uncharacterized protein PRO82_001896 [Candidatus Protochlamydia amoebophila]|jgi:hypothetical protein|uniref:Uncharacterized protein n=1 Tax=Protochlamydia amoebophila (strain UWE25) TaxID=264201 RepID=A0A2P9H9Y6_PARUW|nr:MULTISPECIES: hypothetical protein [Protochlamydia]MBS4164566.1 Uncharacterized protein [Candidatus Protochlamydia amoebophila]SPJ31804.1 unnamed protein product [Candidatus Protochlamydia amoebophila UWE25]
MKFAQTIKLLREANRQTKFFIFMFVLYTLALIWTTVQAYARLEYSRSDEQKPIQVRIPNLDLENTPLKK